MTAWDSIQTIARLPAPHGRLIDRDKPISFTFEDQQFTGYSGDTLASALAANGVRLISRSFKYHRPRGAWSFSGLDANAYVQVGDQPNVPADQLALYDGLVANGQNVWGSLAKDRGSYAGLLSRFLPVGFYYHTFFRPRGAWPYWEKMFRRTAGLGKISRRTQRGYFDKQYIFADVAVIGAGPAGLEAALAAAECGAKVVLVNNEAEPGGALNYARFNRPPDEISTLRDTLVTRVNKTPGIKVLNDTTCSGWFPDNWLSLDAGDRLYKLRAKQVVAATGSIEQPMVFRNNDLPGIIPASGAQRLFRLYGVRAGDEVAIVTVNREGYDLSRDILDSGAKVTALIDLNDQPADPETCAWLKEKDITVRIGHAVTEAVPGPGNRSIKGILIKSLGKDHAPSGNGRRYSCDTLITSAGYSPLAQILCHSGGSLVYDSAVHSFRLDNCPPNAHIAGSINHHYGLDDVRQDGRKAGVKAAIATGFKDESTLESSSEFTKTSDEHVNHPFPVFAHAKGKDFVDFDEDITVADLQNAVSDGFDHPELAKRYSTAAMGPSQGRLSALNVMRVVQASRANAPSGPAVTTQRPPFRPISFGVLAGRSFQPERLTPMHDWHKANGASMMPAGAWKRPAFYGPVEKRVEKIASEVAAVRNHAGLIDVSTLGGIEVRGPDAAEFLNRMYTFAYLKQEVGRIRYLLMTDETGSIIDDGVACRLADDYFYVTTTTTGSDNVYRSMLKAITEWRLEVDVVNVTSAYAAMNIAGPKSRDILEMAIRASGSDIDFGREAFPYLAGRQGKIGRTQVLAMRIGFVGELGYELHVPWSSALQLWEKLVMAGTSFGLRPVGVEAQRILRLEKGHIIVGQDTDGLTFPEEAGLGWAVSSKKGDFVGGSAISILNCHKLNRKLTGFRLTDSNAPLPEECHLVVRDGEITGRVTSVAHSATLDQSIGLAYVAADQAIPGQTFEIKTGSRRRVNAESVEIPFYDPDNKRQRM